MRFDLGILSFLKLSEFKIRFLKKSGEKQCFYRHIYDTRESGNEKGWRSNRLL